MNGIQPRANKSYFINTNFFFYLAKKNETNQQFYVSNKSFWAPQIELNLNFLKIAKEYCSQFFMT